MSTLFVVSTPIGNLEDMTYRAVRVLQEADALACEDTRHTRILLDRYGIIPRGEIFSYHEHNEMAAAERIIRLLQAGRSVAVCSNAGTPGVSDPGYRAVTLAIEAGFRVEVIPGPSAAITALVTSGLPSSSFTFKGFPPRKSGPRRRFLEEERNSRHTLIFYESPFRIGKFLEDALAVLGNRRVVVCMELTKKFERLHRGTLSEILPNFQGKAVKGEITVVIAGAAKGEMVEEEERFEMDEPASEDQILSQ